MTFPEVGQSYLILLENDGLGDVMRVKIEIRDEHFVEDMRVLQNLQKAIAARLRDEILVTPKVELVESNSLPRTEGKAVRMPLIIQLFKKPSWMPSQNKQNANQH